jgi:TetR/AcrR family transcriptional regulator, transcriptional repressor for nem operon
MPTRRTTPAPPAAHATRDRIVRIAAEAWHAKSFDGIGTAELCRRAKVHKGSFFHFFPTKDALLLAVLERYAQQVDADFRAGPFARDVPPIERFTRFFGGCLATIRDQIDRDGCARGCPIGNVVLELSTRSPAIRKAAARVFDVMRSVFKETLDEAVARGDLPRSTDVDATSGALLAYLQGLAVIGKAYGDVDALSKWGARAEALIRAGGA